MYMKTGIKIIFISNLNLFIFTFLCFFSSILVISRVFICINEKIPSQQQQSLNNNNDLTRINTII